MGAGTVVALCNSYTPETPMRLDKLTVKTQEAVQAALDIATRQNNQALEPEHLLLALVQQDDGVVRPLLQKLGAAPDKVSNELEAAIRQFSKVSGGGQPYASNDFNKVMTKAFDEAAKLKDEYVSGDHIALAILDHGKGGAFAALKDVVSALSEAQDAQRSGDHPSQPRTHGHRNRVAFPSLSDHLSNRRPLWRDTLEATACACRSNSAGGVFPECARGAERNLVPAPVPRPDQPCHRRRAARGVSRRVAGAIEAHAGRRIPGNI